MSDYNSEIENLFAEEQLKANSDPVLEEPGINEYVNPYETQPRHFAIGNYAHENAEKFIDNLPPGLDSERTAKIDNTTVRVDRTDWAGNIYEIKPETSSENQFDRYQDQVDKQVEVFNEAYPENAPWMGDVYTYNPQEVENEMIDKGLLDPAPEIEVIDVSPVENDITDDSDFGDGV